MRTKAIIAGAVVLALLLSIAFLFTTHRKLPQDIVVRHVKSVVSGDITTMTFEITNHTADPYIFFPFEVQVRKSNDWTRFQACDTGGIGPIPKLNPNRAACCTICITNLPAGSVVRFAMHVQKTLLGVEGFAKRAELDLKEAGAPGRGTGLPLNPSDKHTAVFGSSKEVVTEEWVETAK